jgi:hypothetical protein
MKSKIVLIAACLLILGLGIGGFAYKTSIGTAPAACACCKGDSCPMKKHENASATDKSSCCDDCDCCKGDSCPMHKKTDAAMKDSCPMHKADAAAEVKHDTTASGEKTCSCSCCSHHVDKKDTAAAV